MLSKSCLNISQPVHCFQSQAAPNHGGFKLEGSLGSAQCSNFQSIFSEAVEWLTGPQQVTRGEKGRNTLLWLHEFFFRLYPRTQRDSKVCLKHFAKILARKMLLVQTSHFTDGESEAQSNYLVCQRLPGLRKKWSWSLGPSAAEVLSSADPRTCGATLR